ncbi:MAG TPA: hypothetical protein VNZ02_10530 [Steroidobacteraceae bacterium]|jgi:hypothetical protein|nr:hypothetical protein [Steroidobacteraceae bacterium]
MHIRNLTLAAAAFAAISPAICNANPETVALQACARAFASSIAAPGSAAPSYTVDYRSGESHGVPAGYYDRAYTFYLRAHSPKSDRTIARATCAADLNGTIVSLKSEPAARSSPALAAQF